MAVRRLHQLPPAFTRPEFLDGYDARFVIVTPGLIDAALAYAHPTGTVPP